MLGKFHRKMNDQKVISPCISICKTDPRTGYCYGCARTEEEKIIWKEEKTSIQWKKGNIIELVQRMSGWQLETFKESYQCKIETGISIFKKNQLKK
tara:strand:- start:578 stop:865 length:288 start_codon:yes stop_codon:yes gene_type:complete